MKWFQTEQTTTSEPMMADRISAAEIAVQGANERIAEADAALAELQASHNLAFDQFGRIERSFSPAGEVHADLAQQARSLWERRTLAIQDFHQALKQWAGLKGV